MSDRNPKVSIGLPVYNGEKYLAYSIESILAQTFDDFELIISDNGSTDATPEIGSHYAAHDNRIQFLRGEVNRGAVWNFNRVFRLARGKYFKWAAHDDLLAPTFLARCVEVLDANPTVAWCQSRVEVINARGHVVESHGIGQFCGAAEALATWHGPCRPQLAASPATHYAHQRFRRVLLGSTSCIDVCGLFRTADLQSTSLWQPYFGWEKVLSGELSLRGRCAEIPEKLFLYRIHEDACSASDSAEKHNAWCDPSATMRSSLVRFHFLMGHIRGVLQAPIGFCDRVLCLLWIGVYLLQFRKWPNVVRQIFGRREIGSGTRDALRALNTQERRTGDVPEMAGYSGTGLSHSTKL